VAILILGRNVTVMLKDRLGTPFCINSTTVQASWYSLLGHDSYSLIRRVALWGRPGHIRIMFTYSV